MATARRRANTSTAQVTISPEDDLRVRILNSFMSCPHRDTDQIKKIHEEIRERDPVFYSHLACWYMSKGEIRDHNEVFASMLITDPFLDNREVGLALFRKHNLSMKGKIIGFIEGKKVLIREKTGTKKRTKKGKQVDQVRNTEIEVGLKSIKPSSFRTDVEKYLRWLESDDKRFDTVALRGRKDLKNMYSKLRIRPSERADKILFKKEIPEDSMLSIFKKISTMDSVEAAKALVEYKVPYTVAVGMIGKITPAVLVALVNSMSPMEIINNMASLEERGANDNPELKALIKKKLARAKTAKNVATLKSKTAVKTGRIKDEEIIKEMNEVADAQVRNRAVISVPTAVFVDRSGSMNRAIEVGKNVAALISGASISDLYVVAFDNAAMAVEANGKSYTDWENAFRAVRPGGCTSMGCALDLLLRKKQRVETIIVITDEGENANPMFAETYEKYVKEMKVKPSVIIIRVQSTDDTFSNNLKRAGIEFDRYSPAGNDYYGLPGLIPLLAKQSKLDLVYEIMDTPLIKRKEFK